MDGLVDFTGGVAERLEISRYDLDHQPTRKRLFEKLVDASDNGALIVTKIEVRCWLAVSAVLGAYSNTCTHYIHTYKHTHARTHTHRLKHTQACTRGHTHAHTHTHTHTHRHNYIDMYTHTSTGTYTNTHTHTRAHTHTHTHTHTDTHAHTHVCMFTLTRQNVRRLLAQQLSSSNAYEESLHS